MSHASTPSCTIIKVGGSTLEDIAALAPLWAALAGLSAQRGVVLVHGGGKAVDALLKKLNLPIERREGLRVTPDDQIEPVAGVLAGSVNKRLVGALNAAGTRAVGLCLGDGAMTTARAMTRTAAGTPVELGRVGEVTGGDPALLRTLLAQGFLPVVSSIGLDAAGGLLNINADDAAAALAGVLHAQRLVLLTDVPGIKGGDGKVRPRLTPADVEAMIAGGEITGGMIVKARAAAKVAMDTGSAVTILSGEDPEALRSYLAGAAVGTTLEAPASASAPAHAFAGVPR